MLYRRIKLLMRKTAIALAFVATTTAPLLAMTTSASEIWQLIRQTPQLSVSSGDVGMKGEDFAGGKPLADFASIGRMNDGTQVMAVPLESGGSGGVFSQLIFAQGIDDARPYFAGSISSGGHLAVNVTYHGIVAVFPQYGPNDPNCCPKKYATQTYTIVHDKLRLLSTRVSAKP